MAWNTHAHTHTHKFLNSFCYSVPSLKMSCTCTSNVAFTKLCKLFKPILLLGLLFLTAALLRLSALRRQRPLRPSGSAVSHPSLLAQGLHRQSFSTGKSFWQTSECSSCLSGFWNTLASLTIMGIFIISIQAQREHWVLTA